MIIIHHENLPNAAVQRSMLKSFHATSSRLFKRNTRLKMLTAEKVIKEIYLLPLNERQKVARHIIEFGIRVPHPDVPEILDMKAWQDEIARKPFNLKQASEYLGVSSVTLRRWVKAGRISASKIGRAYTFDVMDLKNLKKAHLTKKGKSLSKLEL